MDNQVVLNRVVQFQNLMFGHPLTCGEDSRHRILRGEVRDEKVVLVCPDCDYVQDWIPDILLGDDFDELVKGDAELKRRFHGGASSSEEEYL